MNIISHFLCVCVFGVVFWNVIWNQSITNCPLFVCGRAVVSAVRCAARSRGANKLIRAFGLAAPAAADAAAVGAAASTGSTAASGVGSPCDATQQQPRQHWGHHPSTQHSNRQHCRRGRKQPLVFVPQLSVLISTVSVATWPGLTVT